MENNNPILLFDSDCILCNRSVLYIIKKDKKEQFLFCSLQSEKGKELLNSFPENNVDSIVLIHNSKIYYQSDAVLQVCKLLRGIHILFRVFKLIPKNIRDFFYYTIAKNRYRWFGKKDSCKFPDKKLLERII